MDRNYNSRHETPYPPPGYFVKNPPSGQYVANPYHPYGSYAVHYPPGPSSSYAPKASGFAEPGSSNPPVPGTEHYESAPPGSGTEDSTLAPLVGVCLTFVGNWIRAYQL